MPRKGQVNRTGKVHNGDLATPAKVALRERVLEHVTPAHVFDAFCGPDGEMWNAVWKRATSYVGCDQEYKPFDPRRRFVGDNRRVMRAVPLAAYNVFDLDAFGEPWEQLVILAARRTWAPGERGAVILTWSDLRVRWGYASHALADVAGLESLAVGRLAEAGVTPMALRGFFARANVKPVHSWSARGKSNAGSGHNMSYQAIVFDGLHSSSAPAAAA